MLVDIIIWPHHLSHVSQKNCEYRTSGIHSLLGRPLPFVCIMPHWLAAHPYGTEWWAYVTVEV